MNGRRNLKGRRGQWVAVQLDAGVTLRGVLTGVFHDSLVLSHATHLVEGDADLSLGHDEAVIPRSRVLYLQVGPDILRDAERS